MTEDTKSTRRAPSSVLRLAVQWVGALTLTAIVGIGILLGSGKDAPEGLIAIAGGGVGALGTLLTTSKD